jgi:hypothetical protein
MPDGTMTENQLATLRAYAAGQLGTRRAIEQLKLHDFADLVIALSQNDLDLPKPADTPLHAAQIAQASAILQPRLRHGG